MKKILILGAGRSSGSLIRYLGKISETQKLEIVVADISAELAASKTAGIPNASAISIDITNPDQLRKWISLSSLVVSMLPPSMHIHVAKHCLQEKKNLLTASYISPEIKSMFKDVAKAGLLFMNELGLDPGIDHLSAIKAIQEIQSQGATIQSFRSYCGGLVAIGSNDNPWGYKFSWNPRNVVLAGQATATYLEEGVVKYVPPHRIFSNPEIIHVGGSGSFDAYPNRDSLSYLTTYGLEQVQTMIRGTLRQSGFCKAWQIFVLLGLTDDSIMMKINPGNTWSRLIRSFLPPSVSGNIREDVAKLCKLSLDDSALDLVEWTGVFSDTPISAGMYSPAFLLQKLLEEKWKLKPGDCDRVVMHHSIDYVLNGENLRWTADLDIEGNSPEETAMAETVGLPLAVFAELFLNDKIPANLTGVQLPVQYELAQMMLPKLESLGIVFREKTSKAD